MPMKSRPLSQAMNIHKINHCYTLNIVLRADIIVRTNHPKSEKVYSQVCWHPVVMLILKMLRQKDCKFEIILGHIMISCLKKKQTLFLQRH